jgi:hypothetical protein
VGSDCRRPGGWCDAEGVTTRKGPVLLTTSTPVTFTMSDATVGEEGCASRVVTLCCTFWKGNDCTANGVRVRSVRATELFREGMEMLTASFSMTAAVPWICVPSKVSIDASR